MKDGFITAAFATALLVVAAAPLPAQSTGVKPADTTAAADLQTRSLGTVRLRHNVKANGEVLRAGTYQVRLTAQTAKPVAPGTEPSLERWVEFLQGSEVKGREVASVVPAADIAQIAKGRRVPAGSHRVEMLKGNEFVRVWINRDGTNYLIHMPPV